MEPVRVAIVGAGRVGTAHAKAIVGLYPAAELAAVCDAYLPAAQKLADRMKCQKVLTNFDQLLASRDVEAVVIATPNEQHAAMMQAAARADKHFLCEKPACLGLMEFNQTLTVVRESGVANLVGQSKRLLPSFSLAMDKILNRQLGELSYVASRYFVQGAKAPAMVRKAGAWWDLAPHCLDQVLLMAGSSIGTIQATALWQQSAFDVGPDLVEARMLFTNGCMGTVTVSTNSGAGEWLEFEAFGSKGQLTGTLTSLDARGRDDKWRLTYPGRDKSTAGDTSLVFRLQMEQFIKAARGETVVHPTLQDVEPLTRALVLGQESYQADGKILYS